MIPESVKIQIHDLDIATVIGGYVALNRKGRYYECCCPFHNEKTPSFKVNPSKNTWFCYGACQEGGDAIAFVMKKECCSYPEAVKIIANNHGIHYVEQEYSSPEEENKARKRDAFFAAMVVANDFYTKSLYEENEEAEKARLYAHGRWGKNFVKESGIGYAPTSRNALFSYARSKGVSIDVLAEIALIKMSEKNNSYYDFFRGRLVIPIRDRFNRVIGFTARDLTNNSNTPKYLNSAESAIFHKSEILFGIDSALRQAQKEDKMYLVEGAPDALRMHSIGVLNTVASLGGSWSDFQFDILKKFVYNVCFIPDADQPKDGATLGAGYMFVIKNGKEAIKKGLSVSVINVPLAEDGSKQDPDTYFKDINDFRSAPEKDFVIWYASLCYSKSLPVNKRTEIVQEIAQLVALYNNPVKEEMLIDELGSMFGQKSLWKTAIKEACKANQENDKQSNAKTLDRDSYAKYGFFVDANRYYSISKDGDEVPWSNFILEPMLHIKDAINPKRIFRAINYKGRTELIEFKQEELVSLAKFKHIVEGRGNFLWKTNETNLTRLKEYLYENTDTAVEITQLGNNDNGFFAFGNGIFYNDEWYPVDENGVVRLPNGENYYLPAFSSIWSNSPKLYRWERKFIHQSLNGISFYDFCNHIVSVFGDNGMIGICYYLASLFRDVIYKQTQHFPMLNLFGPKGTGKSELGHCLMSFFVAKNEAPNIENSTIAALASVVEQTANALVHLDEFKNDIDLRKREFLKGLWDGTGRTKMNMDNDKKKETTQVDSGVIVSGQEMATADVALFSRMLFLEFNNCEFSKQQQLRFDKLKEIRQKGCTHITLELLRFREKFCLEFSQNYREATKELQNKTEGKMIETRNLMNWVIPIAAFRTLKNVVNVPFSYEKLFESVVSFMLNQNEKCKRNNDIAQFWNILNYLKSDGLIYNDADYKVKSYSKMSFDKPKGSVEFKNLTPILLLRKSRIFMLYKKQGRSAGDVTIPEASLLYYLENSKGYLGTKRSVRFKQISANGLNQVTMVDGKVKETTCTEPALCFDYSTLKELYELSLEVETTDINDEPEESQTNCDNKQCNEPELPF